MQTKTETACVYAIRCLDNDKVYVGSAVDFKTRWLRHRRQLRDGIHHSVHLQRAWDCHGADRFVFEVLESVHDREMLIPAEQYWLDALKSADFELGYNICPTAGSTLGSKMSEEARAKNSKNKKGVPLSEDHRRKIREALIGREITPEARAKSSRTQRGRPKNPESIAKMAESLRGKKLSDEHKAKVAATSKGRRHTEESKAKISEAHKGKNISDEQKAKLRELATKQMQDPEMRARCGAANKGRVRTPEEEAKRKAAFAETIAKRKAAQALVADR